MSFLDRFRRKKQGEASRIALLLKTGRIVEGTIIDITSDSTGHIAQIFYRYNIAGVEYESSQVLNDEQQNRRDAYQPGAGIIVRYYPHQPGNSVVV